MSLIPTLTETLSRARADLRIGLPVVIGGWLAAAVETVSPDRVAAMRALGPAIPPSPVAGRDVEGARSMTMTSPGSRVLDGADPAWLRAVADPVGDLMTPMKAAAQRTRRRCPAPPRRHRIGENRRSFCPPC